MSDAEFRTITKRELVNRIAEQTDQTKVVVRDVIQKFLDAIVEELAVGNRLEFREFGVFEVRERKPRMAQNPRTLKRVEVPAKRVVKFKVGRIMRERVCEEPAVPSLEATNGSGEVVESAEQQPAPPRPQPPTPPPRKPGSPF